MSTLLRRTHSWPSSRLYSFLKRRWFAVCLVLLVIVMLTSRLWKMAEVPAGMYWDEAAIGYNGHAIRTTRRDEWLVKLPVSFKSFGDYKAPLAIYVNGVFTGLFGMNLWAVRLPFVLSGVVSGVMMVLLVRILFQYFATDQHLPLKNPQQSQILSLVAGFLLLTSPWHFFFSRAGFESGMALAFLLTGMVFLLSALKQVEIRFFQFGFHLLKNKTAKISWQTYIYAGLAAICLVAAMYTYHSAKIVVPLLVMGCVVYFKKSALKNWPALLLAGVIGIFLLIPLTRDTLIGKGAERLAQTSIFTSQGNVGAGFQARTFVENMVIHLSPDYLLFGKVDSLRHGDGQWGVLLVPQMMLVLITLAIVLLRLFSASEQIQPASIRVAMFGLMWLLIGILPASIGLDVPHSNRALLALPGFIILSCVGVEYLFNVLQVLKASSWFGLKLEVVDAANLVRIGIGMLLLTQSLLFLSFWQDYFTKYPAQSAEAFTYGYEQAMQFAIRYEDEVEKILFTSKYGQPYIYALFFRRTNPIWYQGGSLIKYEFTDKISEGDLNRKNTVIIATPEQIDPKFADELVQGPEGQVRFVLVRRP